MKVESATDAKVLLAQTIEDAQDQHRKLKAQAAKVFSNARQTESQLAKANDQLEHMTRNATQAVLLADQSQRDGDTAGMAKYTRLAEDFANRMTGLDSEIATLEELNNQTQQAADQARAAIERNAISLRKKLAERQKLLSQLDQAEMQEQISTALAQLTEASDNEPGLDEVRAQVEQRYAKALGASAVSATSAEAQALEIERAAMEAQSRARLDALRAQLGLPTRSDEND